MKSALLAGALALAASAGASPAQAAPGLLDPSFSGDGLAFLAPGTQLLAAAPMSGGRTIAVGQTTAQVPQIVLARVNSGGGVDYVKTGLTPVSGGGVGRAVAVQADGKFVVAGSAARTAGGGGGGMLAERFNADGSPDRSFGANGIVNVFAKQLGIAYAVAIQGDGKVVLAGSVLGAEGQDRVAVVRLNPNGSLDTSFGAGGAVAPSKVSAECPVTGIPTTDCFRNSRANGVALQADGRIVVAGSSAFNLQGTDALVARLATNGALDNSFSGDGFVRIPAFRFGGAFASLSSVVLQGDGRAVVGGTATTGPGAGNIASVGFVGRLSTAGALDGSFSGDGLATVPSSRGSVATNPPPGIGDIALAKGGNILAAGTYNDSGLTQLAVEGFTPSGALAAFGKGGITLTPLGGTAGGEGVAAAVGLDGKLVLAGNRTDPFSSSARTGLFARYDGFGALPQPPATPALKAIALKPPKQGLSAGRDRRVKVPLTNNNTVAARISVKLITTGKVKVSKRSRKVVTFGSTTVTVKAKKKQTLTIRLSKGNAALLARLKQTRVKLVVSVKGVKGTRTAATTRLKAPKR